MPENPKPLFGRKISVFTEGDDDRAILEALQKSGFVPSQFEIKDRNTRRRGGVDGMMSDAAAHLKAAISVIVVRDLDDWEPRDLGRWLDDTLTAKGGALSWETESPDRVSASERLHLRDVRGENGVARLVLVGVGLREDDPLPRHYPIERFTMDDYLLRLVADSEVYHALTEIRREVPYEKAVSKLDEIGRLMDANGLPLRLSKRYLQFLRAIAGFRASPAEFAEGLLERAVRAKAETAIRAFFLPLLDDLEVARGLIGSAPTALREENVPGRGT